MTDLKEIGAQFVNEEDDAEHHGVKGMKWGVRRTDAQLGNASKKDKKESGSGKKSGETTNTSGGTAGMSDAQLKKVVNRIQMEQQYQKLTYKPTASQKATKFMSEIAVNVARQQITAVANKQVAGLIASKAPKTKSTTKNSSEDIKKKIAEILVPPEKKAAWPAPLKNTHVPSPGTKPSKVQPPPPGTKPSNPQPPPPKKEDK